jgi:sarcosine oxidase, subunit beta
MPVSSPDAIVVGAGVIGSSVAYELARDGLAVSVVDRGAGPGQGSTSASSAVVRFNYSTWTGVVSAWESKHLWQSWEEHLQGRDEGGLAKFVQTGGLCLDSPRQDRVAVLALFDRAGIPYEEWDAAEIAARLPQLDPGRHYPPKAVDSDDFWQDPTGELGGYWTLDSGFVDDPQFAAHNLMAAAMRCGARFLFRTTVTAVRQAGGRVVGIDTADGQHIDAPVVVNVAGPHSGAINALAGVLGDFSVRTRPLRQEVHPVPAPPGYGDQRPGPVVLDLDLGTYMRGTPSGQLLIGGTEPDCDPLEWLEEPDLYNPNPTGTVYQAQVYRAARRFPDLAVPNAPRGIAGVYDVSDDWIPIYDRTALPGFYVAIGTSGNQFKNAPVAGRFLADIISACENGRDHDTDPVQVRFTHTGHTADLAHYSRRRLVNEDSSFSVMG